MGYRPLPEDRLRTLVRDAEDHIRRFHRLLLDGTDVRAMAAELLERRAADAAAAALPCPRCDDDGYLDASTQSDPQYCSCVRGAGMLLADASTLGPLPDTSPATLRRYVAAALERVDPAGVLDVERAAAVLLLARARATV